MERTPPAAIRRMLRKEVGFGCPAQGCGNPYLEYHHFDPPWREREHHDPEGMVALCIEHHKKADGGSFTAEQLRAFKSIAAESVSGRFDWLRNEVIAVVGGSLYHETPVIFRFKGERAIWFERDDEGHMLLNLRMVTQSGERRLRLENNDWTAFGEPVDFEAPPSGKRIVAKYANGDAISIEYRVIADSTEAKKRYAQVDEAAWDHIQFPITAVEVEERFGGSQYGFGPTWTKLPGATITGMFLSRCAVGLDWA